jgi:hypothetical protein
MSVHGPTHNAHGTRQYMSDKDIKERLKEQVPKIGEFEPQEVARGLAESLLECSMAASLLSDKSKKGGERTAFLKDLVGNLEVGHSCLLERVKGEPKLAGEYELFEGRLDALKEALNAVKQSLKTERADPVQPFLGTLVKHQWGRDVLEPLAQRAGALARGQEPNQRLEQEPELVRGKEPELVRDQKPKGFAEDKGASSSGVNEKNKSPEAGPSVEAVEEQLKDIRRTDPALATVIDLALEEFDKNSKN